MADSTGILALEGGLKSNSTVAEGSGEEMRVSKSDSTGERRFC